MWNAIIFIIFILLFVAFIVFIQKYKSLRAPVNSPKADKLIEEINKDVEDYNKRMQDEQAEWISKNIREQNSNLFAHPVFSIIQYTLGVEISSMSNRIIDTDKRKFFIDYTSTRIELIRRNLSDFIDKNRNILNVNVSEFNYEVINLTKNIQEQTTSYINKKEESYYRDNVLLLQEKLLTSFTISSNAVGIIISNSNFSSAYEKLNFLFNVYIIICKMIVDNTIAIASDTNFALKDAKTRKSNQFIDKMSSLEEAKKIQDEISAKMGNLI